MKKDEKDLGADAAAGVTARSASDSDAASHVASTPGPWKAGPPAWSRYQRSIEDGKRPITAGDKGVVANAYGEANAHLIAAAPEMYEALIAVERVLRQPADAHAEIAVLQVIRTAIAKAEGRS